MRLGTLEVFVYGSLMRGQANHAVLADARFVGECVTDPSYTLLDLGAYPGLVEGGTTAVHGELFEVVAAGLRSLDRFEDVPHLYVRGEVRLAGRGTVSGYLLAPAVAARGGDEIPGGDWRRRASPLRVR